MRFFFQYKTFLFFYVKDFIFDRYICNMYILADIKWNCRKSRYIKKQRRLLKFFNFKNKIFLECISRIKVFKKSVTYIHTDRQSDS